MPQDFTDIAILGAGPAGANAALAAARQGFAVTLVDEQPAAGGQVWRAKSAAIASAPPTPESRAGDALRAALKDARIEHCHTARVWQIEQGDGYWRLHVLRAGACRVLRAKALILAAGAREFALPVPGWTTPGVLGLAGATSLFKQELTLPGHRTIVSGTGPLVFLVASEIRRLGGQVAAVVTPNSRRDWLRALPAMAARPDLLRRGALWLAGLTLGRVPIYWQHAVTAVQGDTALSGVEIRRLDSSWAPVGPVRHIRADSLCHGHGLIPSIEAAQLAGLALHHDPALGGWIPRAETDGTTDQPGLFVCGDGAGIRGAAAAEVQGQLAGLSAAAHLGAQTSSARAALRPRFDRAARFGLAMTALSRPRPGMMEMITPQTVLCRCENLSRAQVSQEIASGAGSALAVKSGLRAGMGPCGGKFCQSMVNRLIAAQLGLSEGEVPLPTARPPLRPVPLEALAGRFDYDDLPIPKPAPL